MLVRTLRRAGGGVWAVAMLGAMVTGCQSGNPTAPSDTATPSEIPEIPDFTITDLRVGTGIAAANGNFLTVETTLWLYDDTQPDNKGMQTASTAGIPFTFVLAEGRRSLGSTRDWSGCALGASAGSPFRPSSPTVRRATPL